MPAGNTESNAITALVDAMDYDLTLLLSALLADEPYSFYWFDKTSGYAPGLPGCWYNSNGLWFTEEPYWVFTFYVCEYYSKTGAAETSDVDTAKTSAAAKCVDNAIEIINNHQSENDYSKLISYKNEICDLVSYEKNADPSIYTDVWQMIYVFDGDSSTNVVCEGYSKAFQFLCDNSVFEESDETECHTVTGYLNGNNHMWNIVHMDDDCNYIADITNCDTGMIGYPDQLFLKGAESGSVSSGYQYATSDKVNTYKYDVFTLDIFSDAELTMSLQIDYVPLDEGLHYLWYNNNSKACAVYVNSEGHHTRRETVRTSSVNTATCTAAGRITYTAKFTSDGLKTQQKSVASPALGHTWTSKVTKAATDYAAGVRTYTCSRCRSTGTAAIAQLAKVDRPKLTILKPVSSKKKTLTVKWKKLSKAKRSKVKYIQVQYSLSKKFTSKDTQIINVKNTAASRRISGLKSGKTYYVRVRTYKVINGVRHVSKWSKTMKKKIR